jgi:Ni,Fe-hydrogenase III large subunit/Ni,Fe-hydrogenase III component G
MKFEQQQVDIDALTTNLKTWINNRAGARLGLLTSIDGQQLVTLVLDPAKQLAECWLTPLEGQAYKSLTLTVPQAHWFERSIYDMFGVTPKQHPRLKHSLLHDEYDASYHPLNWQEIAKASNGSAKTASQRNSSAAKSSMDASSPLVGSKREYKFLQVQGEGIYELPVGPIHAGVIEPGHFRFSCFGETILNLEIRLGYVHRGVEKRLTEIPWQKARFVAEAAASDTASANAIAHATAIESLFGIEPPLRAMALRTLALEIERLAVHIIDVGGMGTDTGFLAVSATAGRLRGKALALGQMLSGSRFLRAFTFPGGVREVSDKNFSKMLVAVKSLRTELKPILDILLENQVARERMERVGVVSSSLANEFGLVGVAARACGIEYDCRQHFPHASYPKDAPPIVIEKGGDILARTRVRVREIATSFDTLEHVLENLPQGDFATKLPDTLPANGAGLGIVEAFRGELIHLLFTDSAGRIKRYAIKDPSFNNWTAISIAIRNNLIADFPLCNKSLALSYSGNDL